MSDKTTPRPWKTKRLFYSGGYALFRWRMHGDRRIDDKSGEFAQADAELIVKAVNAHERLVAACEAAQAASTAITESEEDGYGACKFCGAQSYPVNEEGVRIVGEDVSDAEEWHTNHDADCVSAVLDALSATLRAALAGVREGA